MDITPRGDRSGALAAFGIQAGALTGEEVPIRAPVARIGRGADNDVVIDDDSVSARHARLEFDEGAWRLIDLESTNGTYVEGVRLTPQVPTPLHYGATVRFGGVPLHFRPVEEADPEGARAEYTAPEPPQRIRERKRRGLPLWLVAVIFVLLVLAVLLFTTYNPPDGPAEVPPVEQVEPAPAPATP